MTDDDNMKTPRESPFRRLYRSLCSLKLGLLLLFLLAIASLAGMLVAQNAPPRAYISQFGDTGYSILHALRLTDVYHSWWFLSLFSLLALNLLFCSLARIGKTYRVVTHHSFLESQAEIQRCKIRRDVKSQKTLADTKEAWLRLLHRRRYRTFAGDKDGRFLLFARKGGASRWGSYVTHLGIILVLLGGIGTARYGFRFDRDCPVGESFDAPRSTFKVRVDDFTIETTPEGQIKDYKSVLTVLDPDSVLTKTIEVNHPLLYRGINFYQASYGQETRRVKTAALQVTNPKQPEMDATIEVPWGARERIPGTDLTVGITDFVPDFIMDLNTREVTTRSRDPRNPALRVAVYRGDELQYDQWVFARAKGMHFSSGHDYDFEILDYVPMMYTGLQITHNPALPLVYLGFAVMTLGIFLSFYINHRRVWLVMSEEKGKIRVLVGGNANKGVLGLEQELQRMVKEFGK